MNGLMDHDEIQEALEAYALGVLDPAEQATVEGHLETCASCRQIVAEYRRVADALPAALAAARPSPPAASLRTHLLRRVRVRQPIVRLPTIAAALTSALALVLLVWATQLSQALAAQRAIYAQLSGQQEIVFEVVDSARATKLFLRPPVPGSTAYGKVFTRPDLPFVVAMAGRLPAPPPGQAYNVWLEGDGRPILAGTLTVNAEGFGSLVYLSDRNGPTFRSVRVTPQPSGATAPDGVPALLWVAPS